uniref:Uncharacterized protein n=1 Tax=Trypanosoma congolense (strain IL3000) TaxID=1068625 RepID=G0UQF7_TRYCI|nr:conserved hypothetical protein [Trypanosoma congolense IL3000]
MASRGKDNGGVAGAETTAAEATRNIILGLPKDGPVPGSSDAASLQAAEAFIGEIQREIMECDVANARAMELYARSWWTRVTCFGKRCKSGSTPTDPEGMCVGEAANGSTAAGSSCERSEHMHVERFSELQAARGAARGRSQPQLNSWFFKLRHPGWVPLIQRPWVPYFCFGCIVIVWTPDVWKLRTLHWCDYQYAELRRAVHRAYWRATMDKQEYKELMEELERGRPPPLGASKCPL